MPKENKTTASEGATSETALSTAMGSITTPYLLEEADGVIVREAENLLAQLDERPLQNACWQIDSEAF